MSIEKLPDSWLKVDVGNIADVISGGTPKSGVVENFTTSSDGIAWLTPADLSGYKDKYISNGARDLTEKGYSSSSAKLMPAGSILFSSRAPIGYTAIAANKISTNQGFKNFVFTSDIYPSYAYYYFRSIKHFAESMGTGTTFKEISGSSSKKLPFIISPLAEQKIIADKLDDLLARVESIKTRLENIPEILKKFRQSVLSAAVSGKLTEEWRNSDSFGENVFLGDLIFNGPQNGLYKPSSFYGRGTKIIRIDSFYDGEIIDWEEIKKIELSKDELDKWALRKNDVLINRVNSIEYLGKCALVKSMPSECVFESNIMRLSLIEGKVIPEYIILYLCSEKGVSELRKNAKLAVNQASINQNDVKSCIIMLPSIDEQKEIIRQVNIFFSYADKVSRNIFRALSKVNVITQSILAKAFRGELTAQWREENPELISSLNSAEALLEKITAEKLAAGTIKKRAKKSSH